MPYDFVCTPPHVSYRGRSAQYSAFCTLEYEAVVSRREIDFAVVLYPSGLHHESWRNSNQSQERQAISPSRHRDQVLYSTLGSTLLLVEAMYNMYYNWKVEMLPMEVSRHDTTAIENVRLPDKRGSTITSRHVISTINGVQRLHRNLECLLHRYSITEDAEYRWVQVHSSSYSGLQIIRRPYF